MISVLTKLCFIFVRKRKEKAAVESVHLEQLESLNAPRPQQVPLIPPQPIMANPHSLIQKSATLDDPGLEVAAAAAATPAAPPTENGQEKIGMKMLQKIPETQEMGATATLTDTTASSSAENLGISDPPELQVELFIREEGDVPEPESQTPLQTQTLLENSENESQDLQVNPKV